MNHTINSKQMIRWWTAILLIVMAASSTSTVFATEIPAGVVEPGTQPEIERPIDRCLSEPQQTQLQQEIRSQLEAAYQDYYIIDNYQWEFTTAEVQDEQLSIGVLLSAEVTLKVNAYGMPYYQALYELWKNTEAEAEAAKLLTMMGNFASEVNFLYYEKPLSETFEFVANVPLTSVAASPEHLQAVPEVYYKGLDGIYTIDSLLLSTEASKAYAREAAQAYLAAPAGQSAPFDTRSQGYNRRAARRYALEEFYNPQFYGQYTSNCANFVSYCLNEGGGLSRTSSWRPGQFNWIRTGYNGVNGVSLHVTRNAGFRQTDNRAAVSAGAVVSWCGFSHVGLITYGDGTKLRFTAHTTYRQDFVLPAAEAVTFYLK